MTLLIPSAAKTIILANFLNKSSPENLILKLYTNDTTPTNTDTEDDYVEITGGGYVAYNLTAPNWTMAQDDAPAVYPQIIFALSFHFW